MSLIWSMRACRLPGRHWQVRGRGKSNCVSQVTDRLFSLRAWSGVFCPIGGAKTQGLLHPALETGGNARKTRAIARGGGRIGKKIYPGQHEAIIEPELWQAVQDRLAAGRRERSI
jgi:hypothetical protein